MRLVLAAAPVLLFAGPAPAALVGFITDYAFFDGVHATVDGVYHPSEYDMTPITMSSASGGGGALTAPAAHLWFNSQSSSLTFGFQPGGPLDHTVIILMSTPLPGGRIRGSGPGITPLNDTTDAARRALSSLQGGYPYNMNPGDGFRATAAVTINPDGFGYFLFPDNQHSTFTQLGAYSGVTGPTGFREAVFGPAFGQNVPLGFSFAVLYADNGILYNEAVPSQPYSAGSNPGQQIGAASPTEFPNYYVTGIFIPTPGAGAGIVFACGLLLRRTRWQ